LAKSTKDEFKPDRKAKSSSTSNVHVQFRVDPQAEFKKKIRLAEQIIRLISGLAEFARKL